MFSTRADYAALTGLELADGWTLGDPHEIDPDATGSAFSVGFRALHHSGREAFCKVLDLTTTAVPPNALKRVERAVAAFNYEWDLLELCNRFGTRRIVHALAAGEASHPEAPLGVVPYIVFEEADSDLRSYMDLSVGGSVSSRVELLHHAALGMRELHQLRIAHQDLKPSNVLVFGATLVPAGKLADIGRATHEGVLAHHDELAVAGAIAYAPPELLYRQVAEEFELRRIACDLYQLGSLVAFVLAGVSINGSIFGKLGPDLHWRRWADAYSAALPSVQKAFAETFLDVAPLIPIQIRDDSMLLISDLCDPQPERRGQRILGGRGGTRTQVLSRVITRLDLIRRKAQRYGLMAA